MKDKHNKQKKKEKIIYKTVRSKQANYAWKH